MVDRVKDIDFRLSEKRKRSSNGQDRQVHNVEDNQEETVHEDCSEEFVELDSTQDIEACMVTTSAHSLHSLDNQSSGSQKNGHEHPRVTGELNLIGDSVHNSAWYLDSGATYHISGNATVFSDLEQRQCSGVKSAGGQGHDVLGIGNVSVLFPEGTIRTIPQVLYSPSIQKNLLSIGSITDNNHSVEFLSEGCYIRNRFTKETIAYAPREGNRGLYRLDGATVTQPEVNMVTMEKPTQFDVWHHRLGHFHKEGLHRMIRNRAVNGLPSMQLPDRPCATCFQGKQARTKIPKISHTRSTEPLQLVHADLCGPFRTSSQGGACYFLSLIDDYSRKTWVYFLARKSDTLDKFRIFHKEVESISKLKLRTLRTDNGGEFISAAFTSYCQDQGIRRQLTVPHTPQQNGVVERRMRSIMDVTRCFLLDKDLPHSLWGEAVRAVVIILNLRSTKRSPHVTPDKLFSGHKPSVSQLRIFGSTVFVHNHSMTKGKLDSHSVECILLSLDDKAKGWRCYDPRTSKVLVSRDVRIIEGSSVDIPSSSADHSLDSAVPTALSYELNHAPPPNQVPLDNRRSSRTRQPPSYLDAYVAVCETPPVHDDVSPFSLEDADHLQYKDVVGDSN
jgi:transposase InsO family protein